MHAGGVRARPSAPTLEAVAREANVSRATVSRVVNGSPKVSPEVVTAVNAAIAKLNYVPNRAARSLASRTSGAVALVVPEDITRFFGDPYFAAIVQGITRRLDESEYLLNLLVASSDPTHKTMRYLRSGVIDGALVVSHHEGDDLQRVADEALPIVFGGRPSRPGDHIFVDVDNVEGGFIGTQHLTSIGRRRIGTIAGPLDMPAGVDRLEGFRRAMETAGMPADAVENADFTVAGAVSATRRLLDRVPDLDAIFVASDLMATGTLAVLRERGRSVPGHVAVVGFDDSPAATASAIPLTTVHQPSEQMGFEMADLLLRRLSGDADVPRRNIMSTHLVRRASA
ncbi:LacI family DNA-binding transcriptional regulator [Agromyces ramosus]|uniref:DNA-binding LacI/PurR family transcriptional regulator n=1 Tax=Agromyces ramosus TaxID=33879 RepID=A0ABU0R8I4_9MICO|nr:LacI family DNA-binding transcriptional regulator [Agromyces ramosus]MDQ0894392.1 DNA-binding LacI/PurR family transcriptional regulator [Agromyces ramosus]